MQAHWLDADEPAIGVETLAREGVLYRSLDTCSEATEATGESAFDAPLAAFATEHGYVHRDEVALSAETPNLDAICAKFVDEHRHDEDEVRFVLEGAGVFDIRSRDDRWMRVTVTPGDLIVVPKDRHHRFFLTDARTIRCVRLFRDPAGWIPHYR